MECLELSTSEVRRYRSRAEKQQIIEEASAPGASVAEVARQHDVNANLVFKWLRDARRSSDVERPPEAVRIEPARALEFVPLGVFGPVCSSLRFRPPKNGSMPGIWPSQLRN